MYINEKQIINGNEYDVDHSKSSAVGENKEVVLVCDEHCKIISVMEIDHNTESVSVKYRINQSDDVEGSYSYHELPEQRTVLAAWMVHTHPLNRMIG